MTEPVRVWLGRAPARPDPADLAVLDADERRRAERCAEPAAAGHYVAARAGVRRAMAAALGTEPGALRWGRRSCPGCGSAAHGPPRLTRPDRADLGVSVSRSGPWWLLAVASGGPVGVDIETSDGTGVGAAVLRRCFSEAERAALTGLSPTDHAALALRGWVRKEAVAKAWGLGTAAELRAVEVLAGRWPAGARHGTVPGPGGEPWSVADLPLSPGLAGALAQPARSAGPVDLVRADR